MLKDSGWFCEVLAGFHEFSEVFRRFFLPIFGKMSRVQLGSVPHSVFRDFHWFFVQFWSCDCFGTIFGRFRCVMKGFWMGFRGFGFERVFAGFQEFFLIFWSCGPLQSVFRRLEFIQLSSRVLRDSVCF